MLRSLILCLVVAVPLLMVLTPVMVEGASKKLVKRGRR